MENSLQNKTFAIHTLGCKVNACESEAIREQLLGCGALEVPFGEPADIAIVNTCTVTNIADRKSRQMLHRARTVSPNCLILATGCYVQNNVKTEADESVDICVGNKRKGEIAQILCEVMKRVAGGEKAPFYYIGEDTAATAFEDLPPVHAGVRTRAFLKIQDGCNQFCSYCIIPFARGRICSRGETSVLTEVCGVATEGVSEVVLNGIHLSSYGLETRSVSEQASLTVNEGELPLLSLLRKVNAIEGIKRIRLGSLEPRALTEETVQGLAQIDKLCPQFHLSLQSGCDKTLRAMNRKYTAEEFAEVVRRLRIHFRNPAITTDIIVGFPQESEEDFQESMVFAKRIGFAQVHVFPYSRRKGTVADRMSGQLTEAEKKRRAGLLIAATEETKLSYRKGFLGEKLSVLFEEKALIDGDWYYIGYSREYVPVALAAARDVTNCELTVRGVRLLSDGTLLAQESVAI